MILSTGGHAWPGGACMAGGCAWPGGLESVCGGGVCVAGGCVVGACMAEGGMCGGGGMRDTYTYPPGRYYGYGIRSMSGRYASYWNAFLYEDWYAHIKII